MSKKQTFKPVCVKHITDGPWENVKVHTKICYDLFLGEGDSKAALGMFFPVSDYVEGSLILLSRQVPQAVRDSTFHHEMAHYLVWKSGIKLPYAKEELICNFYETIMSNCTGTKNNITNRRYKNGKRKNRR